MEMVTVALLMGKLFKEEFTFMESFPVSVVFGVCKALKINGKISAVLFLLIYEGRVLFVIFDEKKIPEGKRVEM